MKTTFNDLSHLSLVATSVEFDDGQVVPLEKAFDYADEHPVHMWPRKVFWTDGSWSWAKGWVKSGSSMLCQIGAGAYGDLTVATRK